MQALGWVCVTLEEEWGAICFHHIILHPQEMEGLLASSRGLLDQKAGFGGVHFHTLGVYHQGTVRQTGRKTSRQWLGLPPALWEGWGPEAWPGHGGVLLCSRARNKCG